MCIGWLRAAEPSLRRSETWGFKSGPDYECVTESAQDRHPCAARPGSCRSIGPRAATRGLGLALDRRASRAESCPGLILRPAPPAVPTIGFTGGTATGRQISATAGWATLAWTLSRVTCSGGSVRARTRNAACSSSTAAGPARPGGTRWPFPASGSEPAALVANPER